LLLISEISFSEDSLWSANVFSRSWIFCSLPLSVLARSALLVRRSSAAFEDLSWSLRRFSINFRSSSWVF
jgi:hypothetical protein